MSNKMHENTQPTNATCTTSDVLQCQCCYDVGICNECWYYSTWQNDGYCDRYHHRIEDSNREKDCFTR